MTKELQTWVKNQTAPYKYPRVIEYVDKLPRTVNGKIRRGIIRAEDEAAAKVVEEPLEPKNVDGLV